MKTITQSGSILALALLLFACGSDDKAGQTSISAPDNEAMEQAVEESGGLIDDAMGEVRELGGDVVSGVVDDAKAVAADAYDSAKGSVLDAASGMKDQTVSAVQDSAQDAAQDAAKDMAGDQLDSAKEALTDAVEDPEEAFNRFTNN